MATAQVNDPHPDYRASRLIWQRIRDVVAGEDAVKARCVLAAGQSPRIDGSTTGGVGVAAQLGDYVPRLDGQLMPDYIRYLNRAPFYGATARTVAGLVGAVFRNDPVIELSAELEELREDADQADTPLAVFVKSAFREVMIMGRYGLLVDFQESEQIPYLCGYTAESILNWQLSRIDDHTMLTRVVLQEAYTLPDGEFGQTTHTQYRVHELSEGIYRVRLFRHTLGTDGMDKPQEIVEIDEPMVPTMRSEPLRELPFVFLGPASLSPAVQASPILDLVNMNLHHFRLTAERNNGLFACSQPQPVIIGDMTRNPGNPSERRVGPGLVLELPQGADAKYLEFGGEGIGAIKQEQDDTEARLVLLGARLLEPQKRAAETAEALRLRQAGDSATLATMADTISWGVSMALGYAATWMGADPDRNYITLSQEFTDEEMSEDDANKLISRWQNGGATLDDTFYLLKKGGRIEPEVTVDQWRLKLADQSPMVVLGPSPAAPSPPIPGESESATEE